MQIDFREGFHWHSRAIIEPNSKMLQEIGSIVKGVSKCSPIQGFFPSARGVV